MVATPERRTAEVHRALTPTFRVHPGELSPCIVTPGDKASAIPCVVDEIFEIVKMRDPHESEFQQAVLEVLDSLRPLLAETPEYADNALLERLVEPERVVSFRVPWLDDTGNVRVNRGYRVQHSSSIGPYKGGLRFHPSVNLSILKFLAFEQARPGSALPTAASASVSSFCVAHGSATSTGADHTRGAPSRALPPVQRRVSLTGRAGLRFSRTRSRACRSAAGRAAPTSTPRASPTARSCASARCDFAARRHHPARVVAGAASRFLWRLPLRTDHLSFPSAACQ